MQRCRGRGVPHDRGSLNNNNHALILSTTFVTIFTTKCILGACPLPVRTQWSAHWQKRLFKRIQLSSKEDLEHWCANIRPGPSGPSSLVDFVVIANCLTSTSIFSPPTEPWLQTSSFYPAPDPFRCCLSASHLQSFSGLRMFGIWGWDTSILQVSFVLHHFRPIFHDATL